jgi:preprotein translocase subunit SecE
MANPLKFVQEVRAETSKVTFPTRNEVVVTTLMVFVLVFLASVFFFLADQLLSWIVSLLLGLAN